MFTRSTRGSFTAFIVFFDVINMVFFVIDGIPNCPFCHLLSFVIIFESDFGLHSFALLICISICLLFDLLRDVLRSITLK